MDPSSSSVNIRHDPQQPQQLQPQTQAVETYRASSNNSHVEQSTPSLPLPLLLLPQSLPPPPPESSSSLPSSCPPSQRLPSPDSFTNNSSMKSELESIVFLDHCHVQNNLDADDDYLPENINYPSLLSRIRAIRGSAQIQYRVPRKRAAEGTRKLKSADDMEVDDLAGPDDQAELSDEIVLVDRQKRVKRLPTRSRVSPYDKSQRKSAKKHRSKDSKRASLANPAETQDLPETIT